MKTVLQNEAAGRTLWAGLPTDSSIRNSKWPPSQLAQLLKNSPAARMMVTDMNWSRGNCERCHQQVIEHGQIAAETCGYLTPFVRENGLGRTFAAETGFLIQQAPDTVRVPDFAFVTKQRIDEAGPVQDFWPGAPDLLAEVVSPSDSFSNVEQKTFAWIAAGTKVVWVVDPRQKHVTVYPSSDDISVVHSNQTLEAPELLPGWSVKVGDLFPG